MTAEILRQAADEAEAYPEAFPDGVGKALAAWLRAEAENDDPCQATAPADCYVSRCSTHRALSVARAILGEP